MNISSIVLFKLKWNAYEKIVAKHIKKLLTTIELK